MNEEMNKMNEIIEKLQNQIKEQDETIKQLYLNTQSQITALVAVVVKRGLITEAELEEATKNIYESTRTHMVSELEKE